MYCAWGLLQIISINCVKDNQVKCSLHGFLSHFQVPVPNKNGITSCFVLLLIDQSIDNISDGRKSFVKEHLIFVFYFMLITNYRL